MTSEPLARAPAVLDCARRYYPFLVRTAHKDIGQIAALHEALGRGRDRRAAQRALYQLARELGWWRSRSHAGAWSRFAGPLPRDI